MDGAPTTCRFDHPGFAAFGALVFRLTRDDRVAAMAVCIDNADVVVPLRNVARLFGIKPDTADGRMLMLIEKALRFAPSLRLGDPLPSEVLTGEASWSPGSYHRQLASARLQMQLVAWIGGIAGAEEGRVGAQMLLVSVEDPAIRPRVQDALRRAAAELGIEGGGPAVAALVEELAAELAYIEALRERLLERVKGLTARLTRTGQEMGAMASGRRETLFQVMRLATAALAEIAAGFEAADAETADILQSLRRLDQHRAFMRPHRDRVYASLLVWEPLLAAWDGLPSGPGKEPDAFWRLVDDSYRFLASRYMAVQAWQAALPQSDRAERAKAAVVW